VARLAEAIQGHREQAREAPLMPSRGSAQATAVRVVDPATHTFRRDAYSTGASRPAPSGGGINEGISPHARIAAIRPSARL